MKTDVREKVRPYLAANSPRHPRSVASDAPGTTLFFRLPSATSAKDYFASQASAWLSRRMATGGLVASPLSPTQHRSADVEERGEGKERRLHSTQYSVFSC